MNIGIIGCGAVVGQYHLPALASVSQAKIKWLCDTSGPRTKRLARAWKVGEAFHSVNECSDVDAVLVATPVGTRNEILTTTTRKGWHALCEKPFACSLAEHKKFLQQAGLAGVKLGTGYMRRYYWPVQKAKQLLQSGAIGRPEEIVASDSAHLHRTGIDLESYRNNIVASGGGVLVESGCHLIDQVCCLTEALDIQVEACVQKTWEGYEVETVARGYLTLSMGAQVPFRFVISGIQPVFSGIAIRCEFGQLRIPTNAARGVDLVLGTSRSDHLRIPHPHPGDEDVLAAFKKEWRHFLDRCTATEFDSADETGVLSTEFIEQCEQLSSGTLAARVCQ